jgi:sialidase-1
LFNVLLLLSSIFACMPGKIKYAAVVFISTMLQFIFGVVYAGQPYPSVFKNKKDGYGLFRIPVLLKLDSGKIVAFCEGRKNLKDNGNIDIVMKTSTDNGKTWSPLSVVWDDGKNTCGNPAPVYDRHSGDIVMLATMNNDKVFALRSADEGKSWTKATDITSTVKPDSWTWYATGPVHALLMNNPKFGGRIVVPCNHKTKETDLHVSHVIYSDDYGFTWQLGGSVPSEKTDECTVEEIADGQLLLNMRNNDRILPYRKISFSSDGGLTWTMPKYDTMLIEPVCQGSLLKYTPLPGVLLFSNPSHPSKRQNLCISVSYDEGKTWSKKITVCPEKTAYSDMVVLDNGDVLCIFETGRILPYGGVYKVIISRDQLLD